VAETDPTAFIRRTMPLCATLQISADDLTPELVTLRLEWAPELCTSDGLLHGGVVMALADSAGGAAAYLNLPGDASGTATIESKTNFIGAIRNGTVVANARPLHVGSSTMIIETEVINHDRLVAKVTQTQTVLRRR
jgi:1,4-dihydroxy-2-naphthoyl-CoA hydrolase